MLRSSILFFTMILLLSSCKSHKNSVESYKSHKKLKVVTHKNQNPTLENSDFLYNAESEEELKKQYKENSKKRKELEKYQPSRNGSNPDEFQRKKKKPKSPQTHY
jgi:hypothetical protein